MTCLETIINMKLLTYQLGSLSTNCYVLVDELTNNAIAIDVGGDEQFLINEEKKHGFNVKTVLLTHGHFDHVSGVYKFYERGANVYMGKGDVCAIEKDEYNLASLFGETLKPFKVKGELLGGETLNFDGITIETISTPGHSEGSITYKVNNMLFCGDVLFKGSFGRVDFLGGDVQKLCTSAKKLLNYDNCTLYPGHGEETTVKQEKLSNPINGYIKYYL